MNPTPLADAHVYSPWRWWVCGLLFLATTLNYMDRIALNQMAVRIQTALNLNNVEYSRLESGFSLALETGGPSTDSWKLPFRMIGFLGAGWVALWFLTVPSRILIAPPESSAQAGAIRYRDIFYDRRFWAILALVIGVNVAWHTYRAWLP